MKRWPPLRIIVTGIGLVIGVPTAIVYATSVDSFRDRDHGFVVQADRPMVDQAREACERDHAPYEHAIGPERGELTEWRCHGDATPTVHYTVPGFANTPQPVRNTAVSTPGRSAPPTTS